MVSVTPLNGEGVEELKSKHQFSLPRSSWTPQQADFWQPHPSTRGAWACVLGPPGYLLGTLPSDARSPKSSPPAPSQGRSSSEAGSEHARWQEHLEGERGPVRLLPEVWERRMSSRLATLKERETPANPRGRIALNQAHDRREYNTRTSLT